MTSAVGTAHASYHGSRSRTWGSAARSGGGHRGRWSRELVDPCRLPFAPVGRHDREAIDALGHAIGDGVRSGRARLVDVHVGDLPGAFLNRDIANTSAPY